MSDNQQEPKLRTEVHYADSSKSWPSALRPASEIAPTLGISAARLLELAESHHCPHWRIDGGTPLFQMSETKRWAAENMLQRIEGKPLPVNLRVMVAPPKATEAPAQIREITDLRQMPIVDMPPGVYFLVDGDEVVYVGQSVNPLARIGQHIADNKKFSRAYMVPVPSSALDEAEGALIRALEPKLNGGLARNGKKNLAAPRTQSNDSAVLSSMGFKKTT